MCYQHALHISSKRWTFLAKHEPRYKFFSSQNDLYELSEKSPECLLQLTTSWKGASFPNVCNAILYIIWFYDWTQNIDKTITSPRSEQLWNDTFLRTGIWLFLLSACSSNAILCSHSVTVVEMTLTKWEFLCRLTYIEIYNTPIAQST